MANRAELHPLGRENEEFLTHAFLPENRGPLHRFRDRFIPPHERRFLIDHAVTQGNLDMLIAMGIPHAIANISRMMREGAFQNPQVPVLKLQGDLSAIQISHSLPFAMRVDMFRDNLLRQEWNKTPQDKRWMGQFPITGYSLDIPLAFSDGAPAVLTTRHYIPDKLDSEFDEFICQMPMYQYANSSNPPLSLPAWLINRVVPPSVIRMFDEAGH